MLREKEKNKRQEGDRRSRLAGVGQQGRKRNHRENNRRKCDKRDREKPHRAGGRSPWSLLKKQFHQPYFRPFYQVDNSIIPTIVYSLQSKGAYLL